MSTHASPSTSAPKSPNAKLLLRRIRDELRVQANLARKEAKSRWTFIEGRLEHPEKWASGARKVLRKARRRVLGLRKELLHVWKGSAH